MTGLRITLSWILIVAVSAALLSAFGACNQIDDDRIPSLPVQINLSGAGMWNTFGVNGVGVSRDFINFEGERQPADFHFTATTYTGFGGVLLIGGMDPFTAEPNVPLAYDLSCPVERSRTIRVAIDKDNFQAVCPVCGSHYDVIMAGGSPVSGPALTGKTKYGLRRYYVEPGSGGGYIIHN